eukprot:GHVP01047509.1.p1 GENE.GHVP01047509.1~~GHVP01047509.1.p1  ORF type:complete len:474 (+),score=114.95 GHVP01047509.1:42-1463(+)
MTTIDWAAVTSSLPGAKISAFEQRSSIFSYAKEQAALEEKQKNECQDIILSCTEESREKLSELWDEPSLLKSLVSKVSTLKLQLGEIDLVVEYLQQNVDNFISEIQSLASKTANPSINLKKLDEDFDSFDPGLNKKWTDLPEEVVKERLRKGEIIPKDEWIPGQGRRTLEKDEGQTHLDFVLNVLNDGKNHFQKKEFETAFLKFYQGVKFVEWVECSDEDIDKELRWNEICLLKNTSECALKIDKWHECLEFCSRVLEIYPSEEKTLLRKARAHLLLGNISEATKIYKSLSSSSLPSDECRAAARVGLHNVRKVVNDWKKDARKILHLLGSEEVFGQSREFSNDTTLTSHKEEKFPETPPLVIRPTEKNKPFLGREETSDLLLELLEIYTDPRVSASLEKMKNEAEYEEIRIVQRAQKILPELIGPTLERWKLPGSNFKEKNRELQKLCSFWSKEDLEIRELINECQELVVGI